MSAFAPITNPINCPWGQKAFSGYFGEDQQEKWKEHDATELLKKWKGGRLDVLIDVVCSHPSHLLPLFLFFLGWILRCILMIVCVCVQGTGDNFYKQGQLLPENFEKAAKEAGVEGVTIRYQPDYDHSYYTMATFSDDHVEHAAKFLFA